MPRPLSILTDLPLLLSLSSMFLSAVKHTHIFLVFKQSTKHPHSLPCQLSSLSTPVPLLKEPATLAGWLQVHTLYSFLNTLEPAPSPTTAGMHPADDKPSTCFIIISLYLSGALNRADLPPTKPSAILPGLYGSPPLVCSVLICKSPFP